MRFRKPAELSLVLLVSACGLLLNQAVLWFAVERLNVDLLVSKVELPAPYSSGLRHVRRSFTLRAPDRRPTNERCWNLLQAF